MDKCPHKWGVIIIDTGEYRDKAECPVCHTPLWYYTQTDYIEIRTPTDET